MILISLENVSSQAYNTLVNTLGLQVSTIAAGIKDLPTNVATSLANVQPATSIAPTSSSSSSRLPIPELAPQLNHSDYPNVRCWFSETWLELKRKGKVKEEDEDEDEGEGEDDEPNPGTSTKNPKPNAKASTTSCYMEDKDGQQQSRSTKDHARATARGFWIKLLQDGMAPTHFGALDLPLKNEYISLMEREYPWLRYCDNHWKAEQIWRGHYPQWYGPAMKKEAARKLQEAAEKAAAEGRVIDVDADGNDSHGGPEESSKRPRPDDDETVSKPKRRRVEEAKSTPLPPVPTKVTTKRARVCLISPFSCIPY